MHEKVSEIITVKTVTLTSPLEIVLVISLTSTAIVSIIHIWSRLRLEMDYNRVEREALRVIFEHLRPMTTMEEFDAMPEEHPGKAEVNRAIELLERLKKVKISGGTVLAASSRKRSDSLFLWHAK